MRHIPCRQDQCPPIFPVDKEDHQISPSVCLPKCGVDIFAGTVPLFNKAELRKISKDLSDLLLLNAVLLCQLFDDVLKPYEAHNFQRGFPPVPY